MTKSQNAVNCVLHKVNMNIKTHYNTLKNFWGTGHQHVLFLLCGMVQCGLCTVCVA